MRRLGLAWSVCLGVYLAGCGGSSSETPPPLEPDPTSYRYTGPRLPSNDAPAAEPSAPLLEPEGEPLPRTPAKPAAATWGSGKPAPSAAPHVEPAQP